MMELHVSNLRSAGFHSCFCEKYITRSSLAINWSSTSSFLHAIFLQKGKDFPWHVKKPMSSRSLVKHGWRALVEHAALGANIALAVERSTAAHHAELGDLVDTSSSYRHVWARYTETFAMSLRFFWKSLWYFSEQAASTGDGLKQDDEQVRHHKQFGNPEILIIRLNSTHLKYLQEHAIVKPIRRLGVFAGSPRALPSTNLFSSRVKPPFNLCWSLKYCTFVNTARKANKKKNLYLKGIYSPCIQSTNSSGIYWPQ